MNTYKIYTNTKITNFNLSLTCSFPHIPVIQLQRTFYNQGNALSCANMQTHTMTVISFHTQNQTNAHKLYTYSINAHARTEQNCSHRKAHKHEPSMSGYIHAWQNIHVPVKSSRSIMQRVCCETEHSEANAWDSQALKYQADSSSFPPLTAALFTWNTAVAILSHCVRVVLSLVFSVQLCFSAASSFPFSPSVQQRGFFSALRPDG